MAGADRVEGTLLGNGERTGNMDIVTMAMNLYSQGVDPMLKPREHGRDPADRPECTQLPVHPRHPWVGELVFTAFSGSHQDAIKKCLARRDDKEPWEVAYLPIDPKDIGRSYQEVIRINSQSGKGGIAFVLQRDYGLELPRWLQIDFSTTVQAYAEERETEVGSEEVFRLFEDTYLGTGGRWKLGNYQVSREDGVDKLQAQLQEGATEHTLSGTGNGVVASFVDAIQAFTGKQIVLVEYNEHALSHSADAEAICYIQLNIDGNRFCGVGRSPDIIQASLDGILGAINKAAEREHNAAAGPARPSEGNQMFRWRALWSLSLPAAVGRVQRHYLCLQPAGFHPALVYRRLCRAQHPAGRPTSTSCSSPFSSGTATRNFPFISS